METTAIVHNDVLVRLTNTGDELSTRRPPATRRQVEQEVTATRFHGRFSLRRRLSGRRLPVRWRSAASCLRPHEAASLPPQRPPATVKRRHSRSSMGSCCSARRRLTTQRTAETATSSNQTPSSSTSKCRSGRDWLASWIDCSSG